MKKETSERENPKKGDHHNTPLIAVATNFAARDPEAPPQGNGLKVEKPITKSSNWQGRFAHVRCCLCLSHSLVATTGGCQLAPAMELPQCQLTVTSCCEGTTTQPNSPDSISKTCPHQPAQSF